MYCNFTNKINTMVIKTAFCECEKAEKRDSLKRSLRAENVGVNAIADVWCPFDGMPVEKR